jgi:hypothetical protein
VSKKRRKKKKNVALNVKEGVKNLEKSGVEKKK